MFRTPPDSNRRGGAPAPTASRCDLTWDVTGNRRLAEWSDVLIGNPLAIIGLVLLGLVARWLLHRLVDRLAHRAEHGVLPEQVESAVAALPQRAATMGGLLKSIITFIVVAVVGTMVLSELGVDIAPIIASAGILGIALGFGAQSLVKDFPAGHLHVHRGPVRRGDVVDVGEANGTVEAVTLRMTRLRDINGTVWYASPTAPSSGSGTRARTGRARSSTSASATARTWPGCSGCCARSPTTCGRTRTSTA